MNWRGNSMENTGVRETTKELTIEPLTRIEGHLGVHVDIDLTKRCINDARAYSPMFRGFEIILKGREPADAIMITQRSCGVCPVPHALSSTIAVEQTYRVSPPSMAIALRNLVHGAEQLYDTEIGIVNLEGPDYSEPAVKKFNPEWWEEAQNTKAEHAEVHGFESIADIMRALNPIEGKLYRKSLLLQREGHSMAAIFGAKHPHVHTFIPGGIAKRDLTMADIGSYHTLLMKHVAFAKELVTITDDLMNFVLEQGYEHVGEREPNLLSVGAYDDTEAYNGHYTSMPYWGKERMVSPGVVLDGELITTDVVEINVGVREFVGESWYSSEWEPQVEADPLGNSLPQEHPWNKTTIPKPGKYGKWDSAYTWVTSPRWWNWKGDGKNYSVEMGPLARMWVTAKAGLVPESTGNSLRFSLPSTNVTEAAYAEPMDFEWKIPDRVNAVERIRARAYYHAFSAYCMLKMVKKALDLMKLGDTNVWTEYVRPKNGIGYGATEAMRGACQHWCVMRNGVIHNYQYQAPTTWNASARDPEGVAGPYEDALINTPITEAGDPDAWKGIDVVRVIRSFDPCLGCAVHVHKGSTIVRHELTPFGLPL